MTAEVSAEDVAWQIAAAASDLFDQDVAAFHRVAGEHGGLGTEDEEEDLAEWVRENPGLAQDLLAALRAALKTRGRGEKHRNGAGTQQRACSPPGESASIAHQ